MRSQYKHLFQREVFAFGHKETCLHNFSSHYPACQFRVFLRVFTGFFFWQILEHFMKKKPTFIVFSFSKESHYFSQRKVWPIKSVFINTTQPNVLLLASGLHKLFYNVFLSFYHKLKKATGAIQKTYFLKKVHSF